MMRTLGDEGRSSTMAVICKYLKQSAGRAPFVTARVSLVRQGLGFIELALLTYEASKRHRGREMG